MKMTDTRLFEQCNVQADHVLYICPKNSTSRAKYDLKGQTAIKTIYAKADPESQNALNTKMAAVFSNQVENVA
jgi:hypothetical protein